MITTTPAKINIGLRVTGKRADGFHKLQSLMLAVGLRDILEIQPGGENPEGVQYTESGIPSGSAPRDNLCEKAYRLMAGHCSLPPVRIHLHKQIPVGAGMGGGSSNASHTLLLLNRMCPSPLPLSRLHELAAELGSDCPFFLQEEAMMMEGRGEILHPFPFQPRGLEVALFFPGIHSSTAEAYAGVSPREPEVHLGQLLKEPIDRWKDRVINDFEEGIISLYPEIGNIKDALYRSGALYASMSGSGSSVYGIFRKVPALDAEIAKHLVWQGSL